MKKPRTMKRYKPKNQTYATAFKVLLSVNHFLNIEFKEGDRWHKVALEHGVMHWFKEVDEFANLPKSVDEIKGKRWYTTPVDVADSRHPDIYPYTLSTKERAEAFLALMQLVELRDAWNGDWKADWSDPDQPKFVVICRRGEALIGLSALDSSPLHFKSTGLGFRFLEEFRDLIETAKELI